ncbi:uncharacterized protein LOC105026157 isoform X1 [Esox lucius]|uniref:uncharacterized protein LOC105026157 isoform X1 n=2 Tax=Esox lucius TaxID=8010 RepID=UPI0014774370|nr:uncharacterized protein LOC105026157 isoform X1 [Esox lucius]XP_010895728.2 uncharacterized protein LOC105026157 isoform X1 [Esox lucius]XP_019901264.2 uncharacterized protein LOC105026157 isoform X1 [Esox lucius]XP_019901265.2 uncharacterized protein LOC105026157 isoform X1 [Esox lucius]XP_019901266.2 uncharacterized protein LOC105026157 isoform X1 [Esox lucius]XP_019901267.2 uncharacterized protein LOC105026157 isoform X1 [Esox lucius]XP_019901268.2 uncharacterized protein LOC105026157 i
MQQPSPACLPNHLNITKIVLMYKLLVLDNAMTTLERELRQFTQQANVEVHHFLSQPRHPDVFNCDHLIRALDAKCYAIEKMSFVFRSLKTDVQFKFSMSTRQLDSLSQPRLFREKRFMIWPQVLKFGPMLQNVLMAGSITKAVKTLSLQQLRISSSSCFEDANFQKDVFICSISSFSSLNKQAELAPSPIVSSVNYDLTQYKQANQGLIQNEQEKICKVNTHQPNTAEVQATQFKDDVTHISNRALRTTNLCLPAPSELLPGVRNKPATQKTALAAPQQNPGRDFIRLQHQKQTSSQLMHFLRIKGKKDTIMEYTASFDRTSYCQHTTSGSTSTTLATTSVPLMETDENVLATNGGILNELSSKCADKQLKQCAPVFTVKRAESGGFLLYSCIIATETELWDIGDILTEATQSIPSSDVINTTQSKMDAAGSRFQSLVEISNLSLHQTAPSNHSLQNTDGDVIENVPEDIKKACQNSQDGSFISPGHQLGVIPEFQIRKFEEMAVTVSHVVHPGNFCVQHADADLKLERLDADSLEDGSSLAELKCIPDIGTYVMAWFPQQGRWCRAEVSKICGMSGDNAVQVEVRRLDYGDTSCVSLRNIKKLSAAMTSLPLQSIQVALANVNPVDGCSWSQLSVSWFRDMVGNRTLYARLYTQGEGDIPRAELFMEKGKMGAMRRGASLSQRLALNGHAKHDRLRKQGYKMSSAQEQSKKRESMWNKHLISCYTQNKKY